MTPLQIEIMLHYHTSAADYRGGDFSAPAVREVIDRFKIDEMLEEDRHDETRAYRLSIKGQTYVKALMEVPEPSKHIVYEVPGLVEFDIVRSKWPKP